MGLMDKEIHAEDVAEYLNQNRQFFHIFPELLTEMSVPHPKSGSEVSLLERQVHNLREQRDALQLEIAMLKDIAGENGALFQKVQAFTEALMRAKDVQQAVDTVYQQMSEAFNVPYVTLFSWEVPSEQVGGLHQLGMSLTWLNTLKETLQPQVPMCGVVEAEWQKGLFPLVTELVKSTCIIPLGTDRVWGVLALGSDNERFHSDQGTYFLKIMGAMITARLDRLFPME
jgi:uncharacterized protein YigA (DUF484 family)